MNVSYTLNYCNRSPCVHNQGLQRVRKKTRLQKVECSARKQLKVSSTCWSVCIWPWHMGQYSSPTLTVLIVGWPPTLRICGFQIPKSCTPGEKRSTSKTAAPPLAHCGCTRIIRGRWSTARAASSRMAKPARRMWAQPCSSWWNGCGHRWIAGWKADKVLKKL